MTLDIDPIPLVPPERAVRYRRDGLWTGETLGDALRSAARSHPVRAALVTADGRLTHRELDELSEDFGAGLLAATELEPGDRVMFQLGNVLETVVAYYGCVKAGIVPVCTLPQHGEREIGQLAQHTGARGHLVQADFRNRDLVGLGAELLAGIDALDTLIVVRGRAPAGATSYDEVLAAGGRAGHRSALAEVRIAADDPVAFQLSGGTTGLPKIAPRRHEEYLYNARVWAEALGLRPDSVVMHPLPIMHNAGIVAALQPAHLVGGTCVVAPGADPGPLLELVATERVTVLPVVPPAVAIRMLEHEAAASTDLSSIERFCLGGQRPSAELLERLERDLRIPTQQMFGMAEGMFLYTPPEAPEWVRRNTVGTPISPADEVRVLDVADETEVPPGTLGELACRGPYTITGYYRAPQHNISAFTSDGFYRTGDLVTRHVVEGRDYYAIDGRIKDVINRGAEKIHAEEVEELLASHPDVRNAALVAMPDPVLGERICAYLVLTDGAEHPTVGSMGEFLIGRGLAKFKLPERIEIVEAFPLTNVGKVSKKDLRADIENKIEKEVVRS
ncbi:2,3-dihydroxybenzoate-AMP ligase [Pseudonocardia ammonioxydans]|uniref:2,3-dihydroxybenzoate-AMP ligase n=1 Tax=Pseudonocardia ammonioxydans TaxID=260086 RepID=A0A1I5H1W4_PSUAM|nr:AMP-binding protein [Pseudonocardia ammonioxydans]SFO42225.1 2,3-dihydroxybenzoate-AMP ligase [Pseudonocardia ammonioxydans]